MKIIITGAKGMLGCDLQKILQEDHEILAVDKEVLNIADKDAVDAYIEKEKPDLIINAAAYNAVDAAENEGEKIAMRVNGEAPGFLAAAAKTNGAKFIHYSTDYVFDGEKEGGIYEESDEPEPISKYGASKLLGETEARKANSETAIVRLSKLFGALGKSEGAKRSFVDIMLTKAREDAPLKVVHDEVGCPTYTLHIAQATKELIEKGVSGQTLHFVNEGPGVTWYEFAREIFQIADLDPEVEPVGGDAFPRPARRPHAVILKNNSDIKLPPRLEALKEFIQKDLT